MREKALIAGDFNAYHTSRGTRHNDKRRDALMVMDQALGLVICNKGNTPNF